MARTARQTSATDVYHVMLRGINQSQLFYDDADRRVFLNRMVQFGDETGSSLLAYALMDNHVHLLLRAGKGQLALFCQEWRFRPLGNAVPMKW
jgi:REP element-mobilizing transposase RayT